MHVVSRVYALFLPVYLLCGDCALGQNALTAGTHLDYATGLHAMLRH